MCNPRRKSRDNLLWPHKDVKDLMTSSTITFLMVFTLCLVIGVSALYRCGFNQQWQVDCAGCGCVWHVRSVSASLQCVTQLRWLFREECGFHLLPRDRTWTSAHWKEILKAIIMMTTSTPIIQCCLSGLHWAAPEPISVTWQPLLFNMASHQGFSGS